MRSKQICLLLINLLCLKNVVLEENEDGNFMVVSTSPPSSILNKKLSKIEQQLQFLTTKVTDSFGEQNGQIKKLLEKQTVIDNALKNNSKQQNKSSAELSKKLQGYDSTVDSFKSQLEQTYVKLESNERLLSKILEREEKIQQRIDQMDEYLLEQFPRDCKEIQLHKNSISGVYAIKPINAAKPFMVWCDMELWNGGWVQVLNRFDGSVDFSRNWTDYKRGFGDLKGELWIGLEHLYELTSSEPHQLIIVLFDWDDGMSYAIYTHFEIGNELEGYNFKNWGTYTGIAGNCMLDNYGQKFSTLDNDQDTSSLNCAQVYNGGWWYKSCHRGKLTGKYFNRKKVANGKGIHWETFGGLDVSLKTAKMIIRPRKYSP